MGSARRGEQLSGMFEGDEHSTPLPDHLLEIRGGVMRHLTRARGELGIEARFFDACEGAVILLFHGRDFL